MVDVTLVFFNVIVVVLFHGDPYVSFCLALALALAGPAMATTTTTTTISTTARPPTVELDASLGPSGGQAGLPEPAVSVKLRDPAAKWHQRINLPRLLAIGKPNPLRTSYFALYKPLEDWKSRCILAAGILLSIAAGVPFPIIALTFGRIINTFPPPEHALIKDIAVIIGVAVIYFFLTWAWALCFGMVGERISRSFREHVVHRAVGMDMAFFDVDGADMGTLITADMQAIQIGTSEKVGLFIQSISYFVASFIVGFILNAKLTGILVATILPAMILIVISGTTVVSTMSKRVSTISSAATNVAQGAIKAVQVVQAFGAMDILADEHRRIHASSAGAAFRKNMASALMLGGIYFACYGVNALAFWEGSRLFSGGAGTVYTVALLILDASCVVGQFGPFIQTFAVASSAGTKVLKLLSRPVSDINVYSKSGTSITREEFLQDIHFNNVSFSYPARPSVEVLNSVNLSFKSGTTTGIVGRSGSGKSSTVSLLLRLYDPTSGSITIGTNELKSCNIASFRRHIALVDQDPVLFSGTILQNISHGIPDRASLSGKEILARCKQAAKDANADFIDSLSHGMLTLVGATGEVSLSGGQRQRICLARALVRRPALLVLDEPTSALDATSEQLILDAIRNLSDTGCTVIMIAHRLATIKDADNIVLMGNGKVLEQGTHDELLDRPSRYQKLVHAQKFDGPRRDSVASVIPTRRPSQIDTLLVAEEEKLTKEKIIEKPEEAVDVPPADPNAMQLLRRCLSLSKPEWPLIAVGIIASIISGAIIIGESIIFGHLVSLLNEHRKGADYSSDIDFFCWMFFIVAVVALLAYSTSGTAFGFVSQRLIARIQDISLRTILHQDIAWFSLPGHSDHALMSSISADSARLGGLSGVIIGTLFSVTTSVLGGLVLSLVVAWKIAIVLMAAVPVVVLAGYFRISVLGKFEKRHESAYNGAAAIASEACASIRTVAAFGREAEVLEEYHEAVRKPSEESFRFLVNANFLLAFAYSITYFVYALAFWWGSKQVRDGEYAEMAFFIVLPALLYSAQSSGQVFSMAPELTRAKQAAASVFALHDQQPTIMCDDVSPKHINASPSSSNESISSTIPTTEKSTPAGAHLSFAGVCFAYPSRPSRRILKSVDLDIPAGSFIGIVGPSGAGKSSLTALLERFYDPTSGAIHVDGRPITSLPTRAHRARLSLVPQDAALFPGSIGFNVSLGGRPGAAPPSPADVERVCRLAGLHDFVASLPAGYATPCGSNGSTLSGGQRQRLAVARALIRDPAVLLLDEATASLDSHAEREVQRALAAAGALRARTTLVVAHRLSTVQGADRIFVLEHGRVVEQGTHEELVAMGGVYSGMAVAQEVG